MVNNTFYFQMTIMRFVIIFIIYVVIDVSSENTTNTEACSCNLSLYCDPDCCCDTNCTNDELLSFNCFPKTNRSEIIGCIQPIFRWNLKYPYEGYFEDGEFCIRKFIEESEIPDNSTSSIDITDKFPFYNASKDFILNNLTPSKSGDPVFVYHAITDSVERFSLPQTSDTTSTSPIGYLHDVNVIIHYPRDPIFREDLSNCSLGDYQLLNISSFIDQQFIENQIYLEQNNETGDVTLAPDSGHAIIYTKCTISNRNDSDCDLVRTEMFNGLCVNLVIEAEYAIRYHGDGISQATLRLTLADAIEVKDFISQRYVVLFRQSNESLTPIASSGHPGYLVGRPLIMADADEESMCRPFNGSDLTLLSSPPDDDRCSTSRAGIQFGRNVITGCSYDYNISSDTACGSSGRDARDKLLTSTPRYVSVNGDARTTPCRDDGWLPIVYSNDTSDNCSDAVVGLEVKVFYSNVGLLHQPLSFIVGMRIEFVKQNLSDRSTICKESYCPVPTSISVHLISTVSFINLSKFPES